MMAEKVRKETWYFCTWCDKRYPNEDQAEECFNRGFHPTLKVGDIVIAGIDRFGWFDGDEKWIARAIDGVSRTGKLYAFYYVVTEIDGDDSHPWSDGHRPRYHLLTKAMTGKQGYRGGYTFDKKHLTPRKVDNPPAEIVENSKDLIGQKVSWLL